MGIFGGSSAIFRVNKGALKKGIEAQVAIQNLIQAKTRNERMYVSRVVAIMNQIANTLSGFHSAAGKKRAMKALKLIEGYGHFAVRDPMFPAPGFQDVKFTDGDGKAFVKALESAFVELEKAIVQEIAHGCVQWAQQIEGMRSGLQKGVNAKAIKSTSKGIQDALLDISAIGQSAALAPAVPPLGQVYNILEKVRTGVDELVKYGDQKALKTLQDAFLKGEGELGNAIRALK